MESRFYTSTLVLLVIILLTKLILASGNLHIPLEIEDTDKQLDQDIHSLFGVIDGVKKLVGCHSFITYTGNFYLKPSLEQRVMEHFSVPIYTVGTKKGPLNHRYPTAENMVIVLFSSLKDPTLAALNDTELSDGNLFFNFLYIPPRNKSRVLTMDEMGEFFSWCWERGFNYVFLYFRGESELETWSYFYFNNITITRVTEISSFKNVLRKHGFRFLVQVSHDPPTIFMYNSTEQADVIGNGSISLSGIVGTLLVEFMRHINSTMDILPLLEGQTTNRNVDIVANLVENASLLYSPVVSDSQICLLVPQRRKVPFNRYIDKFSNGSERYSVPIMLLILAIKYISHRRRSLVDSLFSTLRFSMGIPLPGGRLQRLPLADKIIEVYCMLVVGILISTYSSIFSSVLTTGIHYPPIRDVESLRASGLRIMTWEATVLQSFRDNPMSSSLLDLVDFVDEEKTYRHFTSLNDSWVYMMRTPNWNRFYQEHLKKKRLVIGGPKLCSNAGHLRLPISPKSPLRFIFKDYFQRTFESGLHQKWHLMGFQKFRKLKGITQLPRDTEMEWKPFNLSFYSVYWKMFVGGMVLSILVFMVEMIYKRYRG